MCLQRPPVTLCEDPFHVEPIGGAGLVVSTATHVHTQSSCSCILDRPWVGAADLVLGVETHLSLIHGRTIQTAPTRPLSNAQLTLCPHHNQRDICHVAVAVQLAVVVIYFLEAGLILQAEDQDDSIQPVAELQTLADKLGGRRCLG